MKIHEYQGKDIFRKYGIPVPRASRCSIAEGAKAAAQKLIDETGNEVVVVKAQIHAGGRGKGGGVKVVKGAAAAQEAADEDPRHARSSRTRPGPRARRCSACYIEQGLDIARELYLALRRRPRDAPRRGHGVDRGRHGDRGGRRQARRRRSSRSHVDPAVGLAAATRRASSRSRSASTGRRAQGVRASSSTQLYELFIEGRLLAARDQPADRHQGRRRHRARREDQLRRQRRRSATRSGTSCATCDEEDPVELEAKEAGPQLHLARRQHRLPRERRRPRDGDDGHHQARRRRARELPRRRRRRHARSRSPRRSRSS